MLSRQDKNVARKRRHLRVRKKVTGTKERPRLNVYRSLKHIYAQIVDDEQGRTLVSASSLDEAVSAGRNSCGNRECARLVGKLVAAKAVQLGIRTVVFDRGGYLFHGRVRELAEGAREGGLEF